MSYYIRKEIGGSFEDTIQELKDELKKEGFGVISEIDLKEKFNEKLGLNFRKYTILGACNAGLAFEAIKYEPHIGVMLPCNILVQEALSGEIEISAINPIASMGAVQNNNLVPIAGEVSKRLEKVLHEMSRYDHRNEIAEKDHEVKEQQH
jgi:uncharacterized protein (DUF302 family)